MATNKKLSIKRPTDKLPNLAPVPKKITCTFEQFFMVWAATQVDPNTDEPWAVPSIHFEMMAFLSNYKNWKNRTGVLQIFRNVGKSTIVGLFIVWMLTQNPKLRFLIVSYSDELATTMAKHVQGIIERHPLAQHLNAQEDKNTWRSGELHVSGSTDDRSASVKAKSIESGMTGFRADWIIYDDVEDSMNVQTEHQRTRLREKLREPTHILAPKTGIELFVGTPHTWDSIYPEILGESGKEQPFRSGATSLKIPVMTELQGEFPEMTGIPTWPDRFSVEEILKKQAASGTKGNFLSQYLLVPYNPKDTVLDPTLIAAYNHEIDVHEANGSILARIGDRRVVDVKTYWDPAMGTAKGDASVLAIVFADDEGNNYLHRTVQLMGTPQIQAEKAIQVMKECHVTHVIIETNGAGASFPSIFRERAAGKGISCEGRSTSMKKSLKIVQAFEMRLAGGFLHAHRSVLDSPFWSQLRDFNPSKSNQKDDYIDAVAMAILAQPFRLKAGHFGQRGSTWQQTGGGTFEAPMDELEF